MGKKSLDSFSKELIADIRPLLWFVTTACIALAYLCVLKGFTGALPWLSSMVGLP